MECRENTGVTAIDFINIFLMMLQQHKIHIVKCFKDKKTGSKIFV